jgi:hypothetical protein
MPRTPSTYLMILATAEGLTYVLSEHRMAFPPTREIQLDTGGRVLLYVARNIFGNPTRDRGRIIGTAEIMSPLSQFDSERQIAGRVYTSGCELRITGLAPLGQGVVLADIVDSLDIFQPNPESWGARIRRSILPLSPRDAEVIFVQLKTSLRDPEETASNYLARAGKKPQRRS